MSQTLPSKARSEETTSTGWASSRNAPTVSFDSTIGDVEQSARLLALERGSDAAGEERVGVVRARTQLGGGVRRGVERVHFARQLDILGECAVGREAGELQTGVRDLLAVPVVHLVAVTVALRDLVRPVEFGDDRALVELRRVEAEPHRPAEV